MNDSQSIAALVIVALTVAIFIYKILRKPSGKCGGGCACSMKPKTKESSIKERKTPE